MEQFETLTLKRLLEIFLKNISIILITTILTGVLAFALTEAFMVPKYESYVTFYVNNDTKSTVNKTLGSDIQASQMLVDTYIVILKSEKVLNETVKKIEQKGLEGYSTSLLKNNIAAISVDGTEVFKIMVRDENPVASRIIANTLAEVFPVLIKEYIEASSAVVIDSAVDGYQVSPNLKKNIIFGMIWGFLLSYLFLFLKELFDMRIKDEDELKKFFKEPILGVIPDVNEAKNYRHSAYYEYSHKRK